MELLKNSILEKTIDGKLIMCCPVIEAPPAMTIFSNRCVNPNQIGGVCVPLGECPKLMDIFARRASMTPQKVQFLLDSQCDYQDNKAFVCCVDENDERTTIKKPLLQLPQAPKCGTSSGLKVAGGKDTNIDDYLWTVLLVYKKRQ